MFKWWKACVVIWKARGVRVLQCARKICFLGCAGCCVSFTYHRNGELDYCTVEPYRSGHLGTVGRP